MSLRGPSVTHPTSEKRRGRGRGGALRRIASGPSDARDCLLSRHVRQHLEADRPPPVITRLGGIHPCYDGVDPVHLGELDHQLTDALETVGVRLDPLFDVGHQSLVQGVFGQHPYSRERHLR